MKVKKKIAKKRGVVKPETAAVSAAGYLRLSSDLLPVPITLVRQKPLEYGLTLLPQKRSLILTPLDVGFIGGVSHSKKVWSGPSVRCWFTNDKDQHPKISVQGAFRFLGLSLPKKGSVEHRAEKDQFGRVTVYLSNGKNTVSYRPHKNRSK